MGEGSGTLNLGLSTTVTGIDTGPGEDSGIILCYYTTRLLYCLHLIYIVYLHVIYIYTLADINGSTVQIVSASAATVISVFVLVGVLLILVLLAYTIKRKKNQRYILIKV